MTAPDYRHRCRAGRRRGCAGLLAAVAGFCVVVGAGGGVASPTAVAGTTASAAPSAAAARTLHDAVYSRRQARAGRKLYKRYCISCHGEDYFGQVMLTWQGESLDELFAVMTAMMPQNAPGSLRQQEYLDILAYIMSLEHYPDGERALVLADLPQIEILPPR